MNRRLTAINNNILFFVINNNKEKGFLRKIKNSILLSSRVINKNFCICVVIAFCVPIPNSFEFRSKA